MDKYLSKPLRFSCLVTILIMIFSSFTGVLAALNESSFAINSNTNLDEHPIINPEQQHDQELLEPMNADEQNSDSGLELIASQAEGERTQESYFIPITFQRPQMLLEDGYVHVQIEDCDYIGTPAAPDLPEKRFSFNFLPGTAFQNIEFIPDDIYSEHISQPVVPVQEPIPLSLMYQYSNEPPDPTQPDSSIYASSSAYPEQWYEVNKGMGLDPDNNERTLFLNVRVFPTKFLPMDNQLMYTLSGVLTIDYTAPQSVSDNQENSMMTHGQRRSAQPMNERYTILIIGPELFRQNSTRLAVHKNSTGLPTKFVSITEIKNSVYFSVQGDDDQEKIKYFISDAIKTWNITYVILAGDAEKVPHRNVYITGSMAGNTPADLYYADTFDSEGEFCDWDYDNDGTYGEYNNGNIDKADLYADVILGRLPASSKSELEVLVDKIIYYESFTSGQPWFDNVTMMGTNTFDTSPPDEPIDDIPEGEYAAEYIAENYLPDFTHTKIYVTTTYDRDYPCTSTNIVNALNLGSGFATFHDHGAPQSWAGKFSSSNAQSLTNGGKLPFLNFDACSTGRFDDQDCISEKVVLNPNGGSITSIGASRIGWGQYYEGHITRYSGYFNVHLYKNYHDGEGTAGRIYSSSKYDYLSNIGIHSYADYMTITEYTLFGDPSLSVGGIPLQNINISCEDNSSTVAPSESVEYIVTVSNNGTFSRPIKLYVSGVPDYWEASLSESLIVVPSKGEVNVTLKVNASATAIYQQIADIEVFAYYSKNMDRTISVLTKTTTTRTYGVKLYSSMTIDTVFPGEGASYWFTVTNLGNSEDIINLTANLTNPLVDWEFELNIDDVTIQPYSYQILTLNVTPPMKTLFGSYDINVSGNIFNYFGEGSFSSIEFGINILRTFGLGLSTDDDLLKTFNPGDNYTYEIKVENSGNFWDQYEFSILMYPKAWNISLSKTSAFKVNAFSIKTETLFIDIPMETEVGQYNIKLRAQSKSNHSLVDNIIFTIKINRTYGVELALDQNHVKLDPGEMKEFTLTITHIGNDIDEVSLKMLNIPAKWFANLTEILEMEPFKTYEITFQIAPHLLSITGKYPFQLECTLMGNQDVTVVDMNITVNEINGFSLECYNDNFNIDAGSSQKFALDIENMGNHEDSIEFYITNVPENWNITWTPLTLNTPGANLKLDAFQSTSNVVVTVSTDVKAIAETKNIVIIGTLNSTGEEIEIEVQITINPYYGSKVEMDSEDTSFEVKPDEEFIITINITNEGNTVDQIARNITGLPPGWKVGIPNYTHTLEPFETKREDIRILVPETETEREVDINIRVYSESNPADSDKEKSAVSVKPDRESKPEVETNNWDWSQFDKVFIHWILPIILLIIVILIITFLLIRQRREYKEEMHAAQAQRDREARRDDYDYEAAEQLYGPEYAAGGGGGRPGSGYDHGHGMGGGAVGHAHMRPRPRRRRTKSKTLRKSGSRSPKPKSKGLGAGGVSSRGEPMRWLDEEPTPILPDDTQELSRREITMEACPTCGELVSTEDFNCPYCGEIFEPMNKDTRDKSQKKKKTFEEDLEDTEDQDEWEEPEDEDLEEEDMEIEFEEDEDEDEFELDEDDIDEEVEFEEVDEDSDSDDEAEELEEWDDAEAEDAEDDEGSEKVFKDIDWE